MKTRIALAALASLVLTGRTSPGQTPVAVDLELVIAVDVSYSMGMEEQRAQRDGYVAAFRSPQVINAIHGGALGRIAVTYVEWGGSVVQVVPWTLIDRPSAAYQFAEELRRQPITRLPYTSISNALAYSRQLIWSNGYAAQRRVIDISGDGPNNFGAPAPVARNAAVAEGVIIDGLPIMLNRPSAAPGISDIDVYYESCVIGGPGAFVLTVTGIGGFAEAIRTKLATEISAPRLSTLEMRKATLLPAADASSYNCFIGEELQER